MSPIANLILAVLAVLGAFFYPKLPAAPFSSEMFVQILQWLLTLIAGWNIKSAAKKSELPTVSQLFRK
jgi:hypothetical protein